MSLRVLLADESASIRKVFQMGLQDYGAEVKSVHNGLDVIEVAENFKPDIIFADILLQKKNGYEVSKEVAQNSNLSEVPVVLMWSSFMELDQSQFKECGAQGELEKPFDVESMRSMIQNLVGMTQTQMISSFLKFPASITSEFEGEELEKNQKGPQPLQTAETQTTAEEVEEPLADLQLETQDNEYEEESSVFNSQVAEDDEDFDMYEVQTQTPPVPSQTISAADDEDIPESWEAKPLNNHALKDFKDTQETHEDDFQSMDLSKNKKLDLNEFLYRPEKPLNPQKPPTPPPSSSQSFQEEVDENTVVTSSTISTEETEAIIRSETRSFLASYIQKEFPALLEKIVRDELDKVVQQELSIKESLQEP